MNAEQQALADWLVDQLEQIDHNDDPVMADAGAYRGAYTRLALETHPGVFVHAFEPMYWFFPDDLRTHPRVSFQPVALGDAAGFVDLYIPTRNDVRWATIGSGTRFAPYYTCVSVPCVTLDKYSNGRLTRLDLLKIDVEGAEWPVLDGARETIVAYRPITVLEAQPLNAAQFGYKVESLRGHIKSMGGTIRVVSTEEDWEVRWQE
jgi:FkbM family methyltransferase